MSNNKVSEFFNGKNGSITYDSIYEEMYAKFLKFDDIFLFHSTGTGKTLSSIILAYVYANSKLEKVGAKQIIIRVYTEKNVIPQFKKELTKFKQQFIGNNNSKLKKIIFETFNTYKTLKRDLYFKNDDDNNKVVEGNENGNNPPIYYLKKKSKSTNFDAIEVQTNTGSNTYDLNNLYIRESDDQNTYTRLENISILINIYDEYPNIGTGINLKYQKSNQHILDVYKTYRNLNNKEFIQKNIFLSATPIKSDISDLSRLSALYTSSTIQKISQISEFEFNLNTFNKQIETTKKSEFNFKLNGSWLPKKIGLTKSPFNLDIKAENFPYGVFTKDVYGKISTSKDIIKILNEIYKTKNKIRINRNKYIIEQRESACPQEFFFTFHRRTLNKNSDDFPTAEENKDIIEDVIIYKEKDEELIHNTAYKYLIYYMNLTNNEKRYTKNIQKLLNQKYNAFLGGDIKYSNMLKGDNDKNKKIATVWTNIIKQIEHEINDEIKSTKQKKRYANKFLIHILYPHASDNLNKNTMFDELLKEKYFTEHSIKSNNKILKIIVDRIDYSKVDQTHFIEDCKNLYSDNVELETRLISYNRITNLKGKKNLEEEEYLQKKHEKTVKRYLLIDVYCQKNTYNEELLNHMKNIYNSKYFNVICIIGPMVSVGNEFYCTDILFQTNLFFIPADEDQLHGRVIRKKSHHNCYVEGNEYDKKIKKDFVKIIRIIVHEDQSDNISKKITLKTYLDQIESHQNGIKTLIETLNKERKEQTLLKFNINDLNVNNSIYKKLKDVEVNIKSADDRLLEINEERRGELEKWITFIENVSKQDKIEYKEISPQENNIIENFNENKNKKKKSNDKIEQQVPANKSIIIHEKPNESFISNRHHIIEL
ncbi:MAG: hypothetical protein ISQ46_03900, partial [Methylophilaceae bacterium]|nr:hypothetical protein [Methylophilaceae bacterium]